MKSTILLFLVALYVFAEVDGAGISGRQSRRVKSNEKREARENVKRVKRVYVTQDDIRQVEKATGNTKDHKKLAEDVVKMVDARDMENALAREGKR